MQTLNEAPTYLASKHRISHPQNMTSVTISSCKSAGNMSIQRSEFIFLKKQCDLFAHTKHINWQKQNKTKCIHTLFCLVWHFLHMKTQLMLSPFWTAARPIFLLCYSDAFAVHLTETASTDNCPTSHPAGQICYPSEPFVLNCIFNCYTVVKSEAQLPTAK